jgi:NADPH:quinone reductase-like Zn-dependent oxidoreductase
MLGILSPLISRLYNKKMQLVVINPNKNLAYINELFEAGKIHPVIDKTYKLEEVVYVFWYFGEGHYKGKVVISI